MELAYGTYEYGEHISLCLVVAASALLLPVALSPSLSFCVCASKSDYDFYMTL